jgi:peptidyl-prolyl cis-trans isomerase D
MLEGLRRSQRWVLAILIVALGLTFVFFLAVGGGSGFGSQGSAAVAVRVGKRQFDWRDVDRIRQRQIDEYRRTLGDAFDPSAAEQYLEQMAASALVESALLAREGERMGLRVGEGEMRAFLRSVPGGTTADGRIDREAWTAHAEREYGSVGRFEDALRDDLLARRAARLIDSTAAVSDAEAREYLRARLEEVQLAYVAIDPAELRAPASVDDAAVDALLAKDAARVRAAYDERKAEFDQPEQVRARHVLIRVAPGEGAEAAAAEAAARAKAEKAAARVRGGEAFEKVAAELSEDPGSKDRGGDLGSFPRGRMVPAFEEAAFSLAPGTVSDPVQSSYGFHVIRVDEKKPAKLVPFEEAQRAVARDLLADEKAAAAATELADKLLAAVKEGRPLVDAARERSLAIERPEPVRRRADGAVPGLGAAPEALTALFALPDEGPQTLARVYDVGGKKVLFERLQITRPTDAELDAQLAAARDQLLEERRALLQSAWVDTRRTQLADAGELTIQLGEPTEAPPE